MYQFLHRYFLRSTGVPSQRIALRWLLAGIPRTKLLLVMNFLYSPLIMTFIRSKRPQKRYCLLHSVFHFCIEKKELICVVPTEMSTGVVLFVFLCVYRCSSQQRGTLQLLLTYAPSAMCKHLYVHMNNIVQNVSLVVQEAFEYS